MTNQPTTTQVEDPTDNQDRVLVRNTVTGFEQTIAATAGFFTAGPLGALASWGTIRGVQGKWTPWFVMGIPSAVVINLVQFTIIFGLGMSLDSSDYQEDQSSITTPIHQIYS